MVASLRFGLLTEPTTEAGRSVQKCLLLAACAVLFVSSAHAATVAGGDLGFKVGVSVSSDSNVVDPSGTNPGGKSDYAGGVNLGAEYKRNIGDAGKLSVSYDFTGTGYDDISSRNNVLHLGSVTYMHRIDKVTVGGNYSYGDYRLDGDGFMTLKRASAFLGMQGPLKSVVVASVANTRKEFDGALKDRDADANSVSLSATRKFGANKVKLSYQFADEDAKAAELDYSGHVVGINYARELKLASRPVTMNAGVSYTRNDYDKTNFLIGKKRTDKRTRFELGFEHKTRSDITVGLTGSYQDSSSNLPSADYSRTMIELSVSKRF